MHIILKIKGQKYSKGENVMLVIKYFMLFLILVACTLIGRFLSKKYIYRLNELEKKKNALNVFEAKIKFTYEPIPQIFQEMSENIDKNISNIFVNAKNKMQDKNASIAWEEALEQSNTNLTKEDKNVLKSLSKLLGQTDIEGQTSQIEITQKFLETQIKQAEEEKRKNEKLYSKLGTTIGLAIVIILA